VPALLINTGLGWFWAVTRAGALVAASLASGRDAGAKGLSAFSERRGADELLDRLADDIRRYAAGGRVDFEAYRVDLSTQPPFYRRAQLAARAIPYGEVRTYQWLAARAGNPKAVRAAGQAMAHNPISPIIPCHRVIASGGSLGGYTGGLDTKRALLGLEGVSISGFRAAQ
jgi:methylated-DNA-[protein]-cysteine S-methyltransferase